MNTVVAIHAHQLIPQGNGTYTASVVYPAGLKCQNPDRDAIVGDVLSVTPEGKVIARPAGTVGPWELLRIISLSVVYAPLGKSGPAYLLPYVADIPNV